MIEEPGSFSGSRSSPNPLRGPEPSQRKSSAILVSETASVRNAPLAKTSASCAASAAYLFGAVTKPNPVIWAILAATRSPNSGWVFSPVPTAEPPAANSSRPARTESMRARSASSWAT